jgi:hypothetical protein
MHKRFEDLCALAATGQITGDAMSVLDEHVKECGVCRAFLQDMVSLKAHVAPVVAGTHARTLEPPAGMRQRFVEKAATAGLKLNPGPAIAAPECLPPPAPVVHSTFDRLKLWLRDMQASSHAAFRYAIPVTAAIVCGVLGYLVAQHQAKVSPTTVAVAQPGNPTPAPATQTLITPDRSAEIAAIKQSYAEEHLKLEALTTKLAEVEYEKKDLEQKLASASERASEGAQFKQQFKVTASQLQTAEDNIRGLQADIETQRGKTASAEAVLVAQQSATEDANAKLATVQAQLEQEHELNSVKGSAGDLIAARNLHIVDVYDTESNGSRKKAFGRVFYVEGRSLVFYAYDLPNSKRPDKNLEFRVWGEQADVKSVSFNLGVMHNDDPTQRRWVLTCDDPKVLNRINAVYISPDSDSRRTSEPHRSKMMYAFLGSPNHP